MNCTGELGGLVNQGEILDLSEVYYRIKIGYTLTSEHNIISYQVSNVNLLQTRIEVQFNVSLGIRSLMNNVNMYQFNYVEIGFSNITGDTQNASGAQSSVTLSFKNTYTSNSSVLLSVENILFKFQNLINVNMNLNPITKISIDLLTPYFCPNILPNQCAVIDATKGGSSPGGLINISGIFYSAQINLAHYLPVINSVTTDNIKTGFCSQQTYKNIDINASQSLCTTNGLIFKNFNYSSFMCEQPILYSINETVFSCMSTFKQNVGTCYSNNSESQSNSLFYCSMCNDGYTNIGGICAQNCDATCLNNHTSNIVCQNSGNYSCPCICDCGNYAKDGEMKCNKSGCVNTSFINRDQFCYRKCKNCRNGEAYLDPLLGQIIYTSCKRGVPLKDFSCPSPSILNQVLLILFAIILCITLAAMIVIGVIYLVRTIQMNKKIRE